MSDNYTFYLEAGCRSTNFVIVRQVWTMNLKPWGHEHELLIISRQVSGNYFIICRISFYSLVQYT